MVEITNQTKLIPACDSGDWTGWRFRGGGGVAHGRIYLPAKALKLLEQRQRSQLQ